MKILASVQSNDVNFYIIILQLLIGVLFNWTALSNLEQMNIVSGFQKPGLVCKKSTKLNASTEVRYKSDEGCAK